MKIQFEWDKDKETKNICRHGIDFTLAARIFSDDNRIEFYDSKHSEDEDRYITIGAVGGYITVLVVVYTERYERIRIISARLANKKERAIYYDSCKEY